MAFRRRPMTRSAMRPRRRGAWVGFNQNAVSLPGGSNSFHVLWDSQDWEEQNMTGVARHRVSHLHAHFFAPSVQTVPLFMAWYVAVFSVDASFATIPPTSIWDPLNPGTQNLERRVLASGFWPVSSAATFAGVYTNNVIHEVLEARPRITSDDWIVLVLRPLATVNGWLQTRTNVAC